jgi:hypothetical protein
VELIAIEHGRLFHLADVRPYLRPDGSAAALAIWRGACRACGAAFEVATPAGLASIKTSKALRRVHCDAHRMRRKPKDGPQPSEGPAGSHPAETVST